MTTNDKHFFEELRSFGELEKLDSWWAVNLCVLTALLRNGGNFEKFYKFHPTYPVIFGVDLAETGSDYSVEVTWDTFENKIVEIRR